MNLAAIKEIKALYDCNDEGNPEAPTKHMLRNIIEPDKIKQGKDLLNDDEKRIGLNETAIQNIYVSLMQSITV